MIFPFGRRNGSGLRLIAIAKAKVKGPTRPANIVKIMSIRPIGDNSGVNPIERPTVANAEVASNKIIKKSLPLSVMVSRMVMIETMNNPMNVTDNALNIVSLTMRCRNNTTSSFPLICDQTAPIKRRQCSGFNPAASRSRVKPQRTSRK